MKHQTSKIPFAIFFLLMGISVSIAQAQIPQEALKQYIFDLQKNPNDNALREKIIKHVQTMKPAPAIPEEAERFGDRGEFAVKSAKSEADFIDAAKEYEKALRIAPWVSAYYFNLGIAYEKGGRLKEAKRSFEYYLLSAPDAKDARDVRKRIAGLEYAAEKAAKELGPEVVAEKRQSEYDRWLKSIDGARFIGPFHNDHRPGHERDFKVIVYYVNGQEVRWGWILGVQHNDDLRSALITNFPFNDNSRSQIIQNKQFTIPPLPEFAQQPCTGTVSDDGQFLTIHCRGSRNRETLTRVK